MQNKVNNEDTRTASLTVPKIFHFGGKTTLEQYQKKKKTSEQSDVLAMI